MILGFAFFLLTLALRGASVNRHVKGRLLASAVVFALYGLARAAVASGVLGAGLGPEIGAVAPLLLALGLINTAVALLFNPWRTERPSDRFPTIVQDTIVILLFAVAAAFVLQDRIFTTTAVGAVILGFALQDTLGNFFAGLAIQIEKPFRVGHWVNIAGQDGLVSEITWRATKIRTKAGNFVIVPNSVLSKDTITNYSEPTRETRIELQVGVSYDNPPSQVKAVILDAIRDEPSIISGRQPEVLLVDFAASSLVYRIRLWTNEFGADELIRDRIRCAIYYAFRRSGVVIPYPTQIEVHRDEAPPAAADVAGIDRLLGAVSIFRTLSDEQRGDLAGATRTVTYAAGERIVRQGEAGSSMFVVARGEVVVVIEPSGHEVARIGAGGFFGEMSLLTGEPRSATVKAGSADTELLEITGDAFRTFVLANPDAVEQIGVEVSTRGAELEQRRAAEPVGGPGPQAHFLARVRRFLGLSAVS